MNETQNDCLCHLGFRTSSRANKYTATDAYEYINRLDKNANKKEDLVYAQSINMPNWAQDKPQYFWKMATEHESYQGRQGININIALPNDLPQELNIELMNEFVTGLTNHPKGALPCSYAYHFDWKKDIPNPHFHLLMYERPITEISNKHSPRQFFKKANRSKPERGGVKKITFFKKGYNIKKIRDVWAELVNGYLEFVGSQLRMNPLSYADRGILQVPQIHLGSKSSHQKKEGKMTTRSERNEEIMDFNRRIIETDWIDYALFELANFLNEIAENNSELLNQLHFAEKERYFKFMVIFQRALQENTLQELVEYYLAEYKELDLTNQLEEIINSLLLGGFDKNEIINELAGKNLDIEFADLSFAVDVYYHDLISKNEWIGFAQELFVELDELENVEEFMIDDGYNGFMVMR